MELRHLRYFVAVAEEENVTRAAARLHVSQPPLSRQVRDLEDELGVVLFERTAKSMRLTEAGRVFLDEARAVLGRVREAVATVRAVSEGDRGELNVGYAPSLTVELLPRALRQFHETAPGVKVTLHDLSTEAMLTGLREGTLQVAMMARLSPKAHRGLVFETLKTYRVCVAVAPSHPLAALSSIRLRQLADERLIVYSRDEYPEYHEWLGTLFRPVGGMPRLGEEHESVTSLIAAIEAGRGVSIVSESHACLAGPRLVLRPLAGKHRALVVALAHRAGPLSRSVSRFRDAGLPG